MSDKRKYALGLDIGGTNTVMGAVDSDGGIASTVSVKTRKYETAESFARAVADMARCVAAGVGGSGRVVAMGVGAPGANYYRGTVEHAANLAWGRGVVPLAEMLSELTGLPVVVENDANAAAVGEMRYGAARGMRDFVEVTLGTGVGSGVVAGGRLVHGSDGQAGEMGHMIVRRQGGRECGCGRRGCLETYCSATGVVRTARQALAESGGPSALRGIAPEALTSLDVYRAAAAGDALAQSVFRTTGQIIGEACAEVAALLSPQAFVFFGGLAQAGEMLLAPLREAYEANVLSLYAGKAKFLVSELDGASAAILGAAAMGWERAEGRE